MKRLALLVALLCSAEARAHVGSPNVFFEGRAGAHALSIVIRPPSTLPGTAQVDVRVDGDEVGAVSVQPEFVDDAAESPPAPVSASATAGDARLWSASVWLLRRGSYGVNVRIESPRGGGTLAVPLQAAVLSKPEMPPALGAALVAGGLILVGLALAIAHGAARALGPGRARAVAAGAALVLGAAIYGAWLRWLNIDRAFANALYQPVPVAAEVRSDPDAGALLALAPVADAAPDTAWDTLVTDHGKLMHLFLIRRDGQGAFAHLHPVRRDARRFEGVIPPLPSGEYELYAELTRESGATETLVSKIDVPERAGGAPAVGEDMSDEVWCQSPTLVTTNSPRPNALDFDDSWHTGTSGPDPAREAKLMGGRSMRFEPSVELVADRETSLRFRAFLPDGAGAPIEPYMGMLGHAVVRHADGGVFTHLHPSGTASMAAAALLARRDGQVAAIPAPSAAPAAPAPAVHEVVFPYAFPRAGDYRVWVQIRSEGRVLTGVFDVVVKPS